ncbi:hypothetical protein SprV_0401629700 [Sparganum proliferum]
MIFLIVLAFVPFLLLFKNAQCYVDPFQIVPQNVSAQFGDTVYQACRPSVKPEFITWYVKNEKVGTCSVRERSVAKYSQDPRYKVYMQPDILPVNSSSSLLPTCFLAIESVTESDTADWKCMTVHSSSIFEVSAQVVVFDQNMKLQIRLQNDTHLRANQRLQVTCEALGARPAPRLRFLLGGVPLEQVEVQKKPSTAGHFDVTASTHISLTSRSHLLLLTCHADIGEHRNVRQAYRIIHLADITGNSSRISISQKYLLWIQLAASLKSWLF